MENIQGTLAKIQAKMEERKTKEERELEMKEDSKIIQLPLWADSVRGVPNSILRGSLFAAIQNKNAQYCKEELLHESDKLRIIFSGKRLTQSDLDVWEYALHLSRTQCLGNKIYFSERSFLKGLDRNVGKFEYKWLRSVFTKLIACAVQISHDNQTYIGNLIQEGYREDNTGKYMIIINPRIARLYQAGHTYIQRDERKQIGKRKPLALWLHGYIASHVKFYPHKISTLQEISGSNTRALKHFKASLKAALKHLRDLRLIDDFLIDEKNIVHIKNIPSDNQKKHISIKKNSPQE